MRRTTMPAHQWDTSISECVRCQVRLPSDELADHSDDMRHHSVVRVGVVDHYRLMLPPYRPHAHSVPDPRFAPAGEPPRTELGRYCQQLLARTLIRHEGAA